MSDSEIRGKPIDILLVEDNEGDIRLVKKAFERAKLKNRLKVKRRGDEALDYLFQRGEYTEAEPIDLVLLDLRLRDRDGLEVLEEIKSDENLKRTPVVVLTSSSAEQDIVDSYELHANAFLTKPVDFAGLLEIIQELDNFWLTLVKFPPHS